MSAPVRADRAAPAAVPWARRAFTFPIVVYRRLISPLKPTPTCRFHPTCSAYAVEAVHVHGVAKGTWLASVRLAYCLPFHPGGFDPVPPARSATEAAAARPERGPAAPYPAAVAGAAPEEP